MIVISVWHLDYDGKAAGRGSDRATGCGSPGGALQRILGSRDISGGRLKMSIIYRTTLILLITIEKRC